MKTIMRLWHYLLNPFLIATETNYSNGLKISIYHDNALEKLKGDPVILAMYNTYHPLHVDYKTAYTTWETQGGTQQGETLNLTQLLKLLSKTKIGKWDHKIQDHYDANSPEYKRLLPNHRAPFQKGTQAERIVTVKSLSEAIGDDPLLAEVKADVDLFYAQVDAALNAQKGNKTLIKNKSNKLELARVAMCEGQYANLGALIQKYFKTPEMIAQFFDLQAIRRSQQVFFTGKLKPGEVYTIVKHTFGADDQVWLSNTGNTALKYYLANAKGMQPGSSSITLPKGEKTVLASELGKLTDAYLTVLNTDPVFDGEFAIELM